jgi:hypothetical protein
MRNLLEMIFEYQHLRVKQDQLGIPLDDAERARLLGLGQMLAGEKVNARGDQSGRAFPRAAVPMQVQFTLPGGFETGEVKNVSGSGLAIATARPPQPGTRVIVRVADHTKATEYFFPCRVVWRRLSPLPGMGVSFDGVPTRSSLFGEEGSGVWTQSIRLGDRDDEVKAA